MSRKIVVLHGTNYWSMGDLGLMIALINSLNREFNKPKITILSVFAKQPRPTGQTFDTSQLGVEEKPGLTLYPLGNKYRLYQNTVIFARTTLVFLYLLVRRLLGIKLTIPHSLADSVNALCEADLIISKPGGFLYDYGESVIPAPHQLLTILAATLTGKPVVIYAHSIGPFTRPTFNWLVRTIINRTQLVIVRDKPSLDECQKVLRLRRARIELTADEAFLLEGPYRKVGREHLNSMRVPNGLPLVGFTVVNWYFPSANNPAQCKDGYLQTIAQLIDYINSRYGAIVVVFPFVLRGGYGHAQDDEEVTERVHRLVGNRDMVYICRQTDPSIVKSIQSEMEVFVGSRMHSNIFALSSLVPALAISYLPKTNGMMSLLGLSDFVLDINSLQLTDLQALFDRLWKDRTEIRARLTKIIPEVRAKARQNARMTKDLLENSHLYEKSETKIK